MRALAAVLALIALFLPAAAQAQGQSMLADSGLTEGGRAVSLELVVYRPEGEGPFPLAIVNHGSTGSGDRPELFGRTYQNRALAEFLTRRGYLVVFPQRRGRGRSGGLYDEGFVPDRSRYSCDAATVNPAIARATGDIRAAMAIAKARPDAAPGPILLAGHSRGGLLALLVAAQVPEEVAAVVNFSGGWLGTACKGYEQMNRRLFASAGRWHGPSLFLYSGNDPFYPLGASRKNHKAFLRAGGKGGFASPSLPEGTNGHELIDRPDAWAGAVGAFLDDVRASGAPPAR